jgi:hypothetical protein
MSFGSRRRFLISGGAASAALASAALPVPAFAGGRWSTLTKEAGITVTTRTEKGRQFPTFRGTGRVKADLWKIIAIIQDASKHTQWLHQCSEGGMLKRVDEMTQIVYNRIDAPWPVKDRDVVLRGKIDFINPAKEVKIRFRAINSGLKKKPSDVVRMPVLEGHWYLVSMGPGKTLVEYQVNADPGGELPAWVVEQGSKELPLFTLRNLRKQATKTGSSYDGFIAESQAKIRAAGKWPADAG